MIDTEKLFQAKQALNQFLLEHPELRDYQTEIELALKKCGNSHNRMSTLAAMMRSNMRELRDAMNSLINP